MSDIRLSAIYTIYNEEDYITYSLGSIYSEVDEIIICLTTGKPWFGESREPDSTRQLIENFRDPKKKITLITGEWKSEPEQRNEALSRIKGKADMCLIMDGDELYRAKHLRNIKDGLKHNTGIGQLRISMNTYWKSPLYRIDPPEPYCPVVMTRVTSTTSFIDLRLTNEEPEVVLPRDVGIMYHFSYAKPSEKIIRKMENFSHAHEILDGWKENVWKRWDEDRTMIDLHPTHPFCYKSAVFEDPSHLPAIMADHPFIVNGLNGVEPYFKNKHG